MGLSLERLPGWSEMAAQSFDQLDIEMAASLHDRLTKMDQAIELMQGLRRETAELFAELFPDMPMACNRHEVKEARPCTQ